jgi:hypothetical protein
VRPPRTLIFFVGVIADIRPRIGPSGHVFKEKLLRVLSDTNVKLYFPSEFGVDHTVHDFPHGEWDQKKRHFELAQSLIPDVHICRVYVGLFLEDSIGPWFGFNTKQGRYEAVGSKDSIISFTAMGDVGKAVAALALTPREAIPKEVHISGDDLTFSDIAKIMAEAGAGNIDVSQIDLLGYKKEVLREPTKDPAPYLRFLMGEGNINHTAQGLGSDNDLTNPEEKNWRWKKVTDLAKETHGRPWADYPW